MKNFRLLNEILLLSEFISLKYDEFNLYSDTKNKNRKMVKPVHQILIIIFFIFSFEDIQPEIFLKDFKHVLQEKGKITGTVRSYSGEILPDANIVILNTEFGTSTNLNGFFEIDQIPLGTYQIAVSYIGYERSVRQIEIKAAVNYRINFILKPKSFLIGGIEVIAEKDLLPNEIYSRTVISGGELEHLQATSVNDIFEFAPEIQKSDYEDLSKTTQAAVRGFEEDKNSAFGTSILIDGIPVSNNANMQFEKPRFSDAGSNNINGGVDLRTIPADNIESVEIINGTPSVIYGDFTEGIINIKTKTGKLPLRLKFKTNPDLYEGNLNGSFRIYNEKYLDFNFNIANSERDIRIIGDEYTRLNFQTRFDPVRNSKLNSSLKFNGQFIYDEFDPVQQTLKLNSYNRGYSFGVSTINEYKGNFNIELKSYANIRRENSMKSQWVSENFRILPNGDTVSSFIGKVETRGLEFNSGGSLIFSKILNHKFSHSILFGSDFQYYGNYGEGVVFDTLFSYYGSASTKKPYKFDDLPGVYLASIFAEDKIAGKIIFDFVLSAGFRYDLYNPQKFNLSGLWGNKELISARNGNYVNPRFGLMLKLTEDDRIRLSFGKTSKAPSLASLYQRDEVYKWRNPFSGETVYFNQNLHAPENKGVRETQYEISYDKRLFDFLGLSISGFLRERKYENTGLEQSKQQPVPIFYEIIQNEKSYVYYIGEYEIPQNLGWTNLKGIDLKINSRKIRSLNLSFSIMASYLYNNSSRNGTEFLSLPDISKGQYHNYQVPGISHDTLIGMVYTPLGRWKDQLNVKYRIRYTAEKLGIWLTLYANNLVYERWQDYNIEPKDRDRLNEIERRQYDEKTALKKYTGKWRFNFSLSKSVFDGAEFSFFVNNFLDNIALSTIVSSSNIFYGMEFSTILWKNK